MCPCPGNECVAQLIIIGQRPALIWIASAAETKPTQDEGTFES